MVFGMKVKDLKEFLEIKVRYYNQPEFIFSDPVTVPHSYSLKEDIEIAAFLTSVISWGNRKSIIASASRMLSPMGDSPYQFITEHREDDLIQFTGSVHRTFHAEDLRYFIRALRRIYLDQGGLERFFTENQGEKSLQRTIHLFRKDFFREDHPDRLEKHLSDPLSGSAAKRINMFLRWMIRKDQFGVDFGLWKGISPSILSCPLDLHTGNTARKLGLLHRRQNDAKAVTELDTSLRELDPADPVKYDFALIGLGVFEQFGQD
jgi:uncharacterized protein (TIGR02757 family)